MAASGMSAPGNGSFGSCCDELKEAIAGEEFEPLITVGEDGILYMSVGLLEIEDDEPGMVDHPLFYCPFCGKHIQTIEDVQAKSAQDGEES